MAAERDWSLEEEVALALAGGADLDDVVAILDRRGELADSGVETLADGLSPEQVPVEAPTTERQWWNIRDAAAEKGVPAQDLAEWALMKRAAADREIGKVREHADALMAKVAEYVDRETRRLERRVRWFTGVLDQYAEDAGLSPTESGKIALVNGSLQRVKNRDLIQWDEERALAWAAARPDADAIAPRKLSKTQTKALLILQRDRFADPATGEIVDFVRVVPPDSPTTFKVVQ